MALTFKRVPDGEDVWGRTKVAVYDVTLDTSYPLSTGYVINASDVGLKYFHGASVIGSLQAAGAVVPVMDLGITASAANVPKTSLGLRLFFPTGGATAATSLAAPTATATPASGSTPVTSTAAQPAIPVTAVAGIGKEVGNTANVSSLAYRIEFRGR